MENDLQPSNVIGPINRPIWRTLVMLRRSIKQMKASNDEQYFEEIQKETALYHNLLSSVFVKDQSKVKIAA